MINREIKIGSQIVINKKDKPEKVREMVKKLAASGQDLARIYVLWDNVEPREGVWDFSQYDACFEQAEESGVGIVAQLMAVSPPGWMKLTESSQAVANIEDEKLWARAMDYVDRVVKRYHSSPAMDSWMLWNEPHRTLTKNERNLEMFREYLSRVYNNDIEKLNSLYFEKYKDFDDVETQRNEYRYEAFKGYVCQLDWIRFTIENLCNKLLDIRNQIKKTDKVHPVHINPAGLGHVALTSGQSLWQEAKTVDMMGGSIHPSWHSTRFPVNRYNQSVAYFSDLIKSTTLDEHGRFWVSELQGGTNIYSGLTFMCPDYKDIKQWLWELIGSGCTGVLFWCFNVRDGGCEGGEWSLLNQLGEPSKRLNAVTDVTKTLKANRDLFDNSKPAEPDVWILYSDNTWALSLLQGNGDNVSDPRNSHMAADAVVGAYLMCADLGLNVGFIDEERFVEQGLGKDSVLLAPGCVSLNKETCEAISEFTQTGGTVIADSLIGMYDFNGNLSDEIKGVVNKTFGCEVKDIEAQNKDFYLTLSNDEENLKGWFLKCSFNPLADIEVIGKFEDDEIGLVKNGTAIRIGTVFFQNYLHDHDSFKLNYLKKLLPEIKKDIALENPSRSLRIRLLKSEKADILVVLNSEDKTRASLAFNRAAVLTDMENSSVYNVDNGKAIVDIDNREVKVFKVEWK